MSLTASVRLALAARLTAVGDLGNPQIPTSFNTAVDLIDGVAAGQANRIFADTRTLAASATEDLDLAGTLADGIGGVSVFARVKVLMVHAAEGNTNNVLVGRASANGLASLFGAVGAIVLRPGATFCVIADDTDAIGYGVTAATADLITISNSGAGTAVSYDVVVIGASA